MPTDCGYRCIDGWDVGLSEYGNTIVTADPYCHDHGAGECLTVEVTLRFKRQLPPSLWGKHVEEAIELYKTQFCDPHDREFFEDEISKLGCTVQVEEIVP